MSDKTTKAASAADKDPKSVAKPPSDESADPITHPRDAQVRQAGEDLIKAIDAIADRWQLTPSEVAVILTDEANVAMRAAVEIERQALAAAGEDEEEEDESEDEDDSEDEEEPGDEVGSEDQ